MDRPSLETKVKTISATFTDITPGEPPSLAFHKILTRPDGKQKYMTMSVPIRDKDLLARAEQELRRGDEITVTIETRWAEVGLPKTLLDFSKVTAPKEQTLAGVA